MECIADSTRRVSPYKPLHMQSSPPTVLTRPHTKIQTPYVSITGADTHFKTEVGTLELYEIRICTNKLRNYEWHNV